VDAAADLGDVSSSALSPAFVVPWMTELELERVRDEEAGRALDCER